MIIKINGNMLNAAVSNKVPWWDLSGQMDLAADNVKEQAADLFTDVILGFLEALADISVQLSYSVALIGGAILIILKVTTGSRRMSKWFICLMMVHLLVNLILG